MKAIVHRRYGPPDVLGLEELPSPEPGPGEVRVRVRAASVFAGDVHLLRGAPFFVRFATGLRRPRNPIPGIDLAGIVDVDRPRRDGPSARRRGVRLRRGLARGARVRARRAARAPAGEPVARGGGDRPGGRPDRPPGVARPRPCAAGAAGPRHRRVRRRGHVRRADREGARRRGHGCLRPDEPGARPVDRRGPRHRLHPDGRDHGRGALRRHPPAGRDRVAQAAPPRARARRHARAQQRRRAGSRAWTVSSPPRCSTPSSASGSWSS